MKKEHYIRLRDSKSIIVEEDDEGMTLSVYISGGYLLVSLDKKESLELLEAINDIVYTLIED